MKNHPKLGSRPIFATAALGLIGLAAFTHLAPAQVTPIIERGEQWRYLDTGVTPPNIGGANWKAATYNADAAGSVWKVGRGLFGYGDNISYGTPLTPSNPNTPNNKYITHYFWKSFTIPANAVYGTTASSTYSGFQINAVRDDAVAIYVNGQEVFLSGGIRDNLPAGTLTNTTTALNPIEGQSETSPVTFIDFRNLLKLPPATNTIAVELHQHSNTTSDARFDLSMDLVTVEPCFGDARAGAFVDFTASGRGVANGRIHQREPLEEPLPPDYSWDDMDTEMNWRTTGGDDFFSPNATEYTHGTNLPSQALSFWGSTSQLVWESEVVDVRSFKDIVASAHVLGVKRTNAMAWASGDRFEFILRVSGDGISFRDIPWVRITSTTSTSTSTAWTDLVAESAPKKAMVPTAANNPLNTGAGNWRTRAFNDSEWPTGTKGAGYENNPTEATNYSDLIDPELDFKDQLFGASPRKSVILMRCVFPAVPDRATFNSLRLLMKYDDGFVVHINDEEVARKYVTTAVVPTVPTAALPTPSSLASQGNADTNAVIFEEFNLTSHLAKISTTEPNVLAVYALNDKLDSSDMIVWPVLQIGKPGGPPPVSLNLITPPNTDPQRDYTVEDFTRIDSSQSGPGGTNLIPNGTQAVRLRVVGVITGNAFDKGYYLDDVRIDGTPTVPDSFDNFIAISAPDATPAERLAAGDVDGDSIMNIHEYSSGTDPAVPALFTEVDGVLKPIAPEVYTDANGYAYIRFRLAGGTAVGNAGIGYEIFDLNVRPQISFGTFNIDDWKDEVNAIPYLAQHGPMVENNDGTVTITVRTIETEVRTNSSLYLRLRVGARFPSYLNRIRNYCYRP